DRDERAAEPDAAGGDDVGAREPARGGGRWGEREHERGHPAHRVLAGAASTPPSRTSQTCWVGLQLSPCARKQSRSVRQLLLGGSPSDSAQPASATSATSATFTADRRSR